MCFCGAVKRAERKGLIPLQVHMDGAEFYSNSEYLVWSIGSVLVENDQPLDTKFVICCVPHEAMQTPEVFWFGSVFFVLMLREPRVSFWDHFRGSSCHSCCSVMQVKDACHHVVAQVVGWSLACAASGTAPSTGCFGEALSGERAKLSGCQLAGGWRAAYFGSKYDLKARKEANMFPRSYLHSWVCEQCCAQRKHNGWNSLLTYKNFYDEAPHRLTQISS